VSVGRLIRGRNSPESWFSIKASNGASARKSVKYVDIESNYTLQPIAVESLGPMNESG